VTSLPESISTENGRFDAIFQEPDRKEKRVSIFLWPED